MSYDVNKEKPNSLEVGSPSLPQLYFQFPPSNRGITTLLLRLCNDHLALL